MGRKFVKYIQAQPGGSTVYFPLQSLKEIINESGAPDTARVRVSVKDGQSVPSEPLPNGFSRRLYPPEFIVVEWEEKYQKPSNVGEES